MVVLEGSTTGLADAAAHEAFCELARNLAPEMRVTFRYAAGESAVAGEKPFLLAIEPEDLPSYLGVRGFALVSDEPETGCYRIAVARRRMDRGPAPGREAPR
jgi:hypothetical protein